MVEQSVSEVEADRIRSLKELDILDTPAENRFDRITRLAKKALEVEAAAINFIDGDRQWGKSHAGINDTTVPREESICHYAIQNELITIISDTLQDERFQDSVFVQESPNIRFYMGHPVHSPGGHPIGTLCVFDPEPREPTDREKSILEDLASFVDVELEREKNLIEQTKLRDKLEEAERRSRIDELTELWNRKGIFELLNSEIDRSERDQFSLSVAMIDIDNFKEFNDAFGHQTGDEILRKVAQALRSSSRDYDVVGRYGGEEFLAVFPKADEDQARSIGERMRSSIEDLNSEIEGSDFQLTVSIGLQTIPGNETMKAEYMIERADKALYEAKESGKNCVKHYNSNKEKIKGK